MNLFLWVLHKAWSAKVTIAQSSTHRSTCQGKQKARTASNTNKRAWLTWNTKPAKKMDAQNSPVSTCVGKATLHTAPNTSKREWLTWHTKHAKKMDACSDPISTIHKKAKQHTAANIKKLTWSMWLRKENVKKINASSTPVSTIQGKWNVRIAANTKRMAWWHRGPKSALNASLKHNGEEVSSTDLSGVLDTSLTMQWTLPRSGDARSVLRTMHF